ncbi:MAG: hypothetical protein IKW03_05720 [Clostridia bacterium]|nr:hypothetical protein [Clostridia bacterium]
MKNIPDEKKITGINMPGTHDSACRFVDFGFISQTQTLSVTQQLEAGVRYFDFRFKLVCDTFLANHSICYCRKKKGFWNEVLTCDDIVKECFDFLSENPTETILFQLKEAESHTGDEFYNVFYKKYIEDVPGKWFIENRIPAMGEVRGKIILLRAVSVDKEKFTDKNSGIDFTAYPYVGSFNVDDWRRGELKKLDGTSYGAMLVQDSYKSEGKHKLQTVTRFLESNLRDDEFNICYTSCTRIFVPRINVKYINKQILSYNFKRKYYGIIVTDFIDKEISGKIIRTNF